MAESSGREVVERYAAAMVAQDPTALADLVADDLVEEYPQSGERFVGRDNWLALMAAWPATEEAQPRMERIVGSEDQWVAGPTWGVMKIQGTGDDFWAHGQNTYANGETWHVVQLISLRHGKIARIRSYFAAPFPAPEWRRPYAEQTGSTA